MQAICQLWKSDDKVGPFSDLVCGLTWTLLCANAAVVVLHLLFAQWQIVPVDFVKDMFDLGKEANVPTWFASILWFLVALAAFVCYRVESQSIGRSGSSKMWWVIVLVFLGASADDTATIHENMGSLFAELTLHSGLRPVLAAGSENSPWILFYAPVLVLFLAACVWFLWERLKGSSRLRLILVAAIECYALAVALDYYQGLPESRQYALAQVFDVNRAPFVDATIVVEETLENVGTSLLVIVLAAHANRMLAKKPDSHSPSPAL